MAGDIKLKYGTALTLTVTNLQSLASDANFASGWTSAAVDNTSVLAEDYLVGGTLFGGTTPTAGEVRVYAYASVDGTNWPDLFSAGTEGTQGAATIHDTENLSGLVLLWSSAVDTTSDAPYPTTPLSIRAFLGSVPPKFALYVAHNTVAALKSSGQVLYAQPVLSQYT